MVADINIKSRGSHPSRLIEFNANIIFVADDNIHGMELWEYDGINPPKMITDVNPYSHPIHESPSPENLCTIGSKLYFTAKDSLHGRELWIYDGINPPIMFLDTWPGPGSGSPGSITSLNNKLYFSAYDSINGRELRVYDGDNPPQIVADIYEGKEGSGCFELTVFNNKIYFYADDGIHGYELWEYNGVDPPSMIKDIRPGSEGTIDYDFHMVVFNEKLYFTAYDGNRYADLWEYNGIDSPKMVAGISTNNCCSGPGPYIVFNNKLYFYHDENLWKYDGTNPPVRLENITPSAYGLSWLPETIRRHDPSLVVYDDKLYFPDDTMGSGCELWEYNGEDPPALVADINPGPASSYPSYLTVVNNKLFISAYDDANGFELRQYDGLNPPVRVAKIGAGSEGSDPNELTVFNNRLFFTTEWPDPELWILDGSGIPFLATEIWPEIRIEHVPAAITTVNNRLLIKVNSGESRQLYIYDGTDDPSMVTEDFYGWGLTIFNKKLMYYHCEQLWEFDFELPDTIPECLISGGRFPEPWGQDLEPIIFNQKLYFNYHGPNGFELWECDGTNPCKPTATTWPGVCDYGPHPESFVIFNEKLYFSGFDSCHSPRVIWEYDGLNPPARLADIISATSDSVFPKDHCYPLCVFDNKLYFTGDNGISGNELWEYNGMDPPTQVSDINPGEGDSFREHNTSEYTITGYGQKLYFAANDGIHGTELWEYDGVNPPVLVSDIYPGPAGSGPYQLVVYDDRLYFSADDGNHGRELWSLFVTGTGEERLKRVNTSETIPLRWYPNPVKHNLYIEFESLFSGDMLVIDLKGNVLLNRQLSECQNTSINFTSFVPGQYLIIIRSGEFYRIIKTVRME
jgi:ELWxxDGT repeat protein